MRKLVRISHVLLLSIFLSTPLFAQGYVTYRDQAYDTIPGVDPKLLRLDVYVPTGATHSLPTVMYVHGGYWNVGDKSAVGVKPALFTSKGYVFVSVNYRLSPDPPDTAAVDAVRHPTHARDVAKAIRTLYDNARQFHGDTSRFLLIGHSAGAHLVDIVSTNPRFLEEAGLSLHVLSRDLLSRRRRARCAMGTLSGAQSSRPRHTSAQRLRQ
ncbi:MAG: alpha/beta hydrolase [Ignavibacteria bacterium]|nr:alpha/beta hydrolase [Ignavibacteria bacterium]